MLESEPGLLGIGMATDTETRSDTLKPGESLLLYTDGLPDAMDPADKSFGQDRIQALLEEHRDADPRRSSTASRKRSPVTSSRASPTTTST